MKNSEMIQMNEKFIPAKNIDTCQLEVDRVVIDCSEDSQFKDKEIIDCSKEDLWKDARLIDCDNENMLKYELGIILEV